MPKTYQVMNISERGHHWVCIYDTAAENNPYKLYQKWYDMGWHRTKVIEYADFQSVLWYLLQADRRGEFK